MANYVEQYRAKQGGVTLHTWTEVQGGKKENFYRFCQVVEAETLIRQAGASPTHTCYAGCRLHG